MVRQSFDLWPWISDLEGKNFKILFPAFFVFLLRSSVSSYSFLAATVRPEFFFKAKNRKIWPIFPNFRPLNVDPQNRTSSPYKPSLKPTYHENFVKIFLWDRGEKLFTHSLTDSLTHSLTHWLTKKSLVRGTDAPKNLHTGQLTALGSNDTVYRPYSISNGTAVTYLKGGKLYLLVILSPTAHQNFSSSS